ncbi:serine protease [Lyngbya confervoides]|uniref:Trypsin-like peptidase domain-containing protein n=1 Tax=Lyngbya confervoides BDU141951 TaxID=1574623 RepID=A0ABD4TCL6_9CYAN|nr:serine protease [Lyngbya confervoides]MCM1985390.1 trypsin-like peptidase domain-containing protein [Lyngbya confervoides BDU141951]
MSRFLLPTFLLGVSLAIAAPHPAHAVSDARINAIAQKITVRIQHPTSSGSGILIQRQGNQYTLLTAAHVLAEPGPYQVVTPDGKSHRLTPDSIQSHSQADLAIAQFQSADSYEIAVISQAPLTEGSSVFVAGFPATTAAITEPVYSFTDGKLMAQAKTALADGYGLIYNNQTLPGMSGGPVLNQEGQLIGIHGRADASINPQDESLNPGIFVKSGANLGLPVQLVYGLLPRHQLSFAKSSPHQALIQDLMAQADFRRRQRDIPGATAALDQVIRLDPNYYEAYMVRGDIHLTQRDDYAAIADFYQAVQVDPSLGEGHYNLGLAHLRAGGGRDSIPHFEKAATIFKAKKQTEKYQAAQDQLKRLR